MMRGCSLLMAALLAGCASRPHPPEFAVAPGQYAAAFDAAREVLRDYRFDLQRVDAAAGLITTAPKASGGLATPWDREQSTLRQEVEDMLNLQQRIVRISFEPADDPPAPDDPHAQGAPGPPPRDVRRATGPLIGRVQVVVERVQRPLWQVEETSIGLSSFARDPSLGPRQMAPRYAVPFAQDERLAGRIAAAIARETAEPAGDGSSRAGPAAPAAQGPPSDRDWMGASQPTWRAEPLPL